MTLLLLNFVICHWFLLNNRNQFIDKKKFKKFLLSFKEIYVYLSEFLIFHKSKRRIITKQL